MKKRILFAGLLLLLTLSTFAATPVTSGKTNAQKIVEAIHNPKTVNMFFRVGGRRISL